MSAATTTRSTTQLMEILATKKTAMERRALYRSLSPDEQLRVDHQVRRDRARRHSASENRRYSNRCARRAKKRHAAKIARRANR